MQSSNFAEQAGDRPFSYLSRLVNTDNWKITNFLELWAKHNTHGPELGCLCISAGLEALLYNKQLHSTTL